MPQQSTPNPETSMVLSAIQNMKSELTTTITSKINAHTDEKFNNLYSDIKNIKTNVEKNTSELNYIKRENRKKNLIFYGLDEEEANYNELELNILNILNLQLSLNFTSQDIDFARRLGKKESNKQRPILVTFLWYKKVIEILANKKKLANSKIAISEDFPEEVLARRKELLPIMKKLREESNHAYIKYDKLIVNGKLYTNAETLEEEQKRNHIKRIRSDEQNTEKVLTNPVIANMAKKQRGRPPSLDRNNSRKNSNSKGRNSSIDNIFSPSPSTSTQTAIHPDQVRTYSQEI